MKRSAIIHSVTSLLVLLFVYTATSKLLDYDAYRLEMRRQVLPAILLPVLTPVLPAAELLMAPLLLIKATHRIGLYAACLLMLLFTIYVGLAVAGVYPHLPCTCGGVISGMSWTAHLALNIIFLLLTIVAIVFENRERRSATSD
jgi:putative oxidoreductase